MLDTRVDIESENQMNLSFGYVIQHLWIFFFLILNKSIENTFKFLKDMLDNMVDVENEYQQDYIK